MRSRPRAAASCVALRDAESGPPGEDVTDAALPRLVAAQAGDDAAVDYAAHARDVRELVAAHHVTGRRAHDRDHLPGLDRPSGGRGDMGIDVSDADRDALRSPMQRGPSAVSLPAGGRAARSGSSASLVGANSAKAGLSASK